MQSRREVDGLTVRNVDLGLEDVIPKTELLSRGTEPAMRTRLTGVTMERARMMGRSEEGRNPMMP